MPGITFIHKGQFEATNRFFRAILDIHDDAILNKYGQRGVQALASATPTLTGQTAGSWSYTVNSTGGGKEIVWSNSNINDGFQVAVGLQFGHGTGWGGYVSGIDYINPAMQPIFEAIADELWQEVTRA